MTGGTLPPAHGMGNLSTLLKRLEAATSRLEDIAMAQAVAPPNAVSGASALVPSGSASTSPVVGGAAVGAAAGIAAATAVEDAPAVQGYDTLINGPLATYLALSNELGGLTAQQATFVAQAFQAQRTYLEFASACTKLDPSSPTFAERLGPTSKAIMDANDIKDKNRGSSEANFLSTVSEGLPALGWVQVEPKPGPHVNEFKEAAAFWGNRVIKANKESNPKAAEWAKTYVELLEELRKYVMQYHTTGVSWNPKGADPKTYKGSSSSATAVSGAPAPPPPPPPPPPAPVTPSAGTPSPKAAATGDMSAVFASLNQGEGVTRGLKKVDKSEMTHKNPELRSSGVVGAVGAQIPSSAKGPVKPPKPSSFQKKPPKTELERNKWIIENHENSDLIEISNTEISQTVDIFNVKSSVIKINGKVNAISMVNSTKVQILLDSTVSSLAISASPSFTVQILGKVPTILIDGTDGGQVYLSRESLDVEIITAKSSAINVSLPVDGEEAGVFEEKAVPEQLKTVVKNGKLVTTVVEHSG
ncbi:hypothetical protein T439DRAFT_166355 [Meredithblackwellia eburnea MCA 4105]